MSTTVASTFQTACSLTGVSGRFSLHRLGDPTGKDVYVSARLVSIEFKVIYVSQMIYYGQ